jgi:ABC-type lipoprotein export system ATPase subunit
MRSWLRRNKSPMGQEVRFQTSGANGHGKSQALQSLEGPLAQVTEPMIDLRGITKVYETAAGPFPALKGIDLRVYPGEFVAVVGKSGSGKSTLINVFTGIDHPTDGEAIVAQTHIRRLDEGQMAEWRGRHLGIVFQFFQLLPTLTIVENVMLPMDLCQVYDPGEREKRALYLLEQVGIAADAGKFPAAVSGGQQQRAAIARALANDPPMVVADEPSGNLDSKAAEVVFRLFESLVAEGKTILMVTHDEDLAARAPRTVTLADGEIVDEVVRVPAPTVQPAAGSRPYPWLESALWPGPTYKTNRHLDW